MSAERDAGATCLESEIRTRDAEPSEGLTDVHGGTVAPSQPEPPRPEPAPGWIVAGRYRLVERLGAGAQGEVWSAEDVVVREDVALKWMRRAARPHEARIRREITTLRMLRVPGVARLLDEGVDDGQPFLVMERASGTPFPGGPARGHGHEPGPRPRWTWDALAAPTLALLEVLARVHAAGVVHRDLKPANILVSAEGRPTVLDFGVSHWRDPLGPQAEEAQVVGTPRYLAPEQILGGAVDARADLYAVGVILFEALTGQGPHEASSMVELLRARLNQPAPPVAALAPELPPEVGAVIDRLLSRRPEQRFGSAAEVLAALRGQPSGEVGEGLWARLAGGALRDAAGPLGEDALRPLFAGPDRLLHLREDAARALWARTEGVPARVEAELTLWLRLGLARWDGPLLSVDRDALGRIEAGASGAALEPAPAPHRAIAEALRPGEEGRLFHLLAAAAPAEAADEALALAARHAREGQLGAAAAALAEGLRAARQAEGGGGGAREARILAAWASVAFAEGTALPLDRVLYEISRARRRSPELAQLEALVRAGLAASGASGSRAVALVAAIQPFEDPALERWRQRTRVVAAAARSSPALLEEVLAEVEAWAARSGEPMAQLGLAEGRALLRYGQGRFEEAAALHAEAAARDPWPTGRIAATLAGASALLEAFRHTEAAERAAAAQEMAARLRHPSWEARAQWLVRAAHYRMGIAGAPDLELVEAAAYLGVQQIEALIDLNEAAVAFRAGQPAVAARLAERAAAVWKEMDRPWGSLLARSLAIACGAAAHAGEAAALGAQALRCPVPGIGVQAVGLLGRACPAAREGWAGALEGLLEGIPREHWHLRIDVLSVEEALSGARG